MSLDWERRRRKILDSSQVKKITLEVLEEWYEQAARLAEEHGWSPEEALRMALNEGLAYLKGELGLRKVERADTPERVLEEFQETTRQMMEESSRAAVLKFQAYQLSQDNQVLELHESALKNELLMARNRLKIFRDDDERLRERIRELEAEVRRLEGQLAALQPDGRPTVPAGSRAWRFWKR